MQTYSLRCFDCKADADEKRHHARCPRCGGPLEVVFDYGQLEQRINFESLRSASLKATKYLRFYPINDYRKVVSLDEGGTPLYRAANLSSALGASNFSLSLKNEGLNPTGAFKDRGSMVEMTKAVEAGAKAVCCASTGNMAASVSAYACKQKLPCYVLVPDGTPPAKMAQTLSYGARVLQVKGTYNDAERLASQLSEKHNFRLMGDYAFRVEGQKSQAFEICEQLAYNAPDFVIVPIGCGTNLAAIWKGFREFKRFGLIEKLPRMVGVQASGCSTVVKAFNSGSSITPVQNPDTLASAIAAGNPLDGSKALAALEESKGIALEVSDDEMLEAQQQLAKSESIFAEPSAASTIAAVLKLKNKLRGEVVCILTGNGLKDAPTALKGLSYPPSVEPNILEVEKFVREKLYNLKAPVRKEAKAEVIFRYAPTRKTLAEKISSTFNVSLSDADLAKVESDIEEFISKGKVVSRSDLKSIIEESLTSLEEKKRALRVLDFTVTTGSSKKPKSEVAISFNGRKAAAGATGDGPVDATINAIRSALKGKGPKFSLTDYNVSIDTGGTEATVVVTMAMVGERKNKVVSKGASPDIVAASVRAFEIGYNILYLKQKGKYR